MRGALWSTVVLVLSACPATKESPLGAELWRVTDFDRKLGLDAGDRTRALGGFRPEEFVTFGGPNGWDVGLLAPEGQNRVDGGTLQINVLPGLAGGRNVSFVVTEVWQDAPAPWVDPVYQVPLAAGAGNTSVFGVRLESNFYTPFWVQRFVNPDMPPQRPVKTVREVLALAETAGGISEGAPVMCPFVPQGTTIAQVRPFTGEALQDFGAARLGFADGEDIWYFDFGPDTFRATPRGVISRGFLYVFNAGERAVLPYVLPNDPQLTLLQRVEVSLAPDAGVFGVALPPGYDALAEELKQRELKVFVMDGQLPDGGTPLAFAGRVARNPACFDAGFPASCTWLDSEAAIRALPSARLRETSVLVAASRIPLADGGGR